MPASAAQAHAEPTSLRTCPAEQPAVSRETTGVAPPVDASGGAAPTLETPPPPAGIATQPQVVPLDWRIWFAAQVGSERVTAPVRALRVMPPAAPAARLATPPLAGVAQVRFPDPSRERNWPAPHAGF